MPNRRRHRAKPPRPAPDTEAPTPPSDLFRGHDPAEVEERLIEVFSDMPCDLGSDDMAPPDQDDLEMDWRLGGEDAVEKTLAEWRAYCEWRGRSDGEVTFIRPANCQQDAKNDPAGDAKHSPPKKKRAARASAATPKFKAGVTSAKSSKVTFVDVTADLPGLAFVILGAEIPPKRKQQRQQRASAPVSDNAVYHPCSPPFSPKLNLRDRDSKKTGTAKRTVPGEAITIRQWTVGMNRWQAK